MAESEANKDRRVEARIAALEAELARLRAAGAGEASGTMCPNCWTCTCLKGADGRCPTHDSSREPAEPQAESAELTALRRLVAVVRGASKKLGPGHRLWVAGGAMNELESAALAEAEKLTKGKET